MPNHNYLNISYGSAELEGFTNILLNPGEDPHAFSRKGLPFPERSVKGIYCLGIIERFSQTEILIFLRECRRVLEPEGVIRISTADLQYLIDRYTADSWHNPLLKKQEAGWVQNKAEYLNVQMRSWDRAWICDAEELRRLADLAGLESNADNLLRSDTPQPFQSLPITSEGRLVLELSKRRDIFVEAPLVSVVIPAYRPDFLAACLESALAQTYQSVEIVICDDSKSDAVEAIVQSYTERSIAITYVRNPAQLGEARNLTQAINLAKGEFIKPLYDDDLLTPECIDELVSAFANTPDVRLAAGQRLPIDETGKLLDTTALGTPLALQSTRLSGQSVIAEIVDAGFNTLGEPTVMLFRREDILALGEPDVMSLFGRRCAGIGDVGLALQLLSRGDLAYVAKPIAYFRRHSGQNQNRPEFDKWMRSSWAYVQAQAARLGLDKVGASAPLLLSNEAEYSDWLQMRTFVSEDFIAIEKETIALGSTPPNFQILLRLLSGQDARLADTLDSLASQVYPNWHLDIVTAFTAPEGLDEIENIGWHVLSEEKDEKQTIDLLVRSRKLDWVIELPAGAKLDPLYLWRVARQTKISPEAHAFFSDDDLCNAVGTRSSPRFKPGTNPAAMLSADLAGPLCVRQRIWEASGGASQRQGSPWFTQLLGIAGKLGWSAIKHIPDVLISYPDYFPSDTEACLSGLLEQMKNQQMTAGEIIPMTGQSWRIRYPLTTRPSVSIAILSAGQHELLCRCLASIIKTTNYRNFEILIVLTESPEDPDLQHELEKFSQNQALNIRTIISPAPNYAAQCNAAVSATSHELILLIKEGSVIIQPNWLEELIRTCLQSGIAAASPRLIRAGTTLIENAGNVIGLCGPIGTPYQGQAKIEDNGYLDSLQVARDVSALSAKCTLIRTKDYRAVGGMDEIELGDHLADADLCQKLIKLGKRLIYQPLATLADGNCSLVDDEIDEIRKARTLTAQLHANRAFSARWLKISTVDPFFNPNFSLSQTIPTLETGYRAQWQYLPTAAPRILARTLPNAQGTFRVASPLAALRKTGQASACIWPQENSREPSATEVLRLAPDTFIAQHYLSDPTLRTLEDLHQSPHRPFMIYTIDDLLTKMDDSNPFRHNIPANCGSRLKYALNRCDRMISSTEFLAEVYRHLIPDIRIIPNRLEQELWLPLQSKKRTGKKPRIGWAGGTTHQSDLLLLKEVIEQTRDEADWIFFGMCPDEIQPLLTEYHPQTHLADYPARLAGLNLDLAVAPLAETAFNHGKSNLRLLEYGILGIPVVCTDITPYRNSPACQVINTPEAWAEALRERIYDADAREREGGAMRQWVQQHYLLENHLDEWLLAHLPS